MARGCECQRTGHREGGHVIERPKTSSGGWVSKSEEPRALGRRPVFSLLLRHSLTGLRVPSAASGVGATSSMPALRVSNGAKPDLARPGFDKGAGKGPSTEPNAAPLTKRATCGSDAGCFASK